MKPPPFRCLFCLRTNVEFSRTEHPIPESLGNYDVRLEPGWICDSCNQYFGSKVEATVLNTPPFGIERIAAAVKTKKRKLPSYSDAHGLEIYGTGFLDHLVIVGPRESIYLDDSTGTGYLFTQENPSDQTRVCRMLLKMGIEILAQTDAADAFSKEFDAARRFARCPQPGSTWEYAYGIYPRRTDLLLSTREDEYGPLITHQLYQYELGQLASGAFGFSFMFRTHIFTSLLSRPDISGYVRAFNRMNQFKMETVRVVV